MFRSRDKKSILLCVPKTGSHTLFRVLPSYAVRLRPKNQNNDFSHETFSQYCELLPSDSILVERVYAFWRDPVERFISAVNCFRSYHDSIVYMAQNYSKSLKTLKPTDDIQEGDPNLTKKLRSVTPEEFFNNKEVMSIVHFAPQVNWYKDAPKDKLRILNFKNFEAHVKNIFLEFSGNKYISYPYMKIPRILCSDRLTTILSPELEDAVKEYYAEDYDYKPQS